MNLGEYVCCHRISVRVRENANSHSDQVSLPIERMFVAERQ
jgi:hypothetical protein